MKKIAAVLAFLSLPATGLAAPDWDRIADSKGVTVYSRPVEGSSIAEIKAHGVIDAPPATVLAVLADVGAYSDTMPHTKESKVLRREGNEIWAYSLITPPMIKPRDFCVKIMLSKLPRGGFATDWIPADDVGPRKGVVRIEENSGSWRLESTNGGKATFATYMVHADPGGGVPKWVVNKTQKTAIPDIFEAVRKAARSEKYQDAPLVLRDDSATGFLRTRASLGQGQPAGHGA